MRQSALYLFLILASIASAQTDESKLELKQLDVPTSPAFILLDASPTLIETPKTPKAFILGVVQAFNKEDGWPQNYTTEVTPYWWFKPAKRSVYSLAGLEQQPDSSYKSLPGAAAKFTNISLAFIQKDMVPDTIANAQKIISAGVRTTLIKVNRKGYAREISDEMKAWHSKTLTELDLILDMPTGLNAEQKKDFIKNANAKFKTGTAAKIKELMNERPVFSWDLAAGVSGYGLNDTIWKTGRAGVWTTFSGAAPFFISAKKKSNNKTQSYFDGLLSFRYMYDGFHMNPDSTIMHSHIFDFGAKAMLELENLSVSFEIIGRKNFTAKSRIEKRMVGIVSYKFTNNLSLTGTFGNDFGLSSKKIITLLGINWGFGKEMSSIDKPN